MEKVKNMKWILNGFHEWSMVMGLKLMRTDESGVDLSMGVNWFSVKSLVKVEIEWVNGGWSRWAHGWRKRGSDCSK